MIDETPDRPRRTRRPAQRYETREFSLPLETPLGTANGEMTARDGSLVAIETDGETIGVGEATPLPGWTESVAECRRALADSTGGGVDPRRGRLPPASAPAARHGVTLAAQDAQARNRGVSLASMLVRDDDPATTVPVNATVGDDSVAETVAAAETAVESGFETLKLKVGARDVATDVRRVRAVADAVSDCSDGAVSLRADANGAWDRQTARTALEELDGLVEYVEQPLPATDLDGLAALRGVGAPVAADESLAVRGPFAVLAAEAADTLVCKPMALGGLSRTLAAARAAAVRGVETVVTTTIDGVVARTAATHLAAAVPGGGERAHGLATGDLLERDITATDGSVLTDPVSVENGAIRVPESPGLAGDSFESLF